MATVPSQYAATNGSTPPSPSAAQPAPAPVAAQVTIELPPDAEPDYQPPPIDLTEDVDDDNDVVQDDDSMPLPNVPVGDHR